MASSDSQSSDDIQKKKKRKNKKNGKKNFDSDSESDTDDDVVELNEDVKFLYKSNFINMYFLMIFD